MNEPTGPDAKLEAWLDAVARGELTMSQRSLSTVERAPGGLDALVAAARQRGLHLLRLTDDAGRELLAASRTPFEVLC